MPVQTCCFCKKETASSYNEKASWLHLITDCPNTTEDERRELRKIGP